MPHPLEQGTIEPLVYTPNPTFETPAVSAVSNEPIQPVAQFSGSINPFLRAPLITRQRSGLRKW
jgi:hypothetical protein